MLDLKNVRFAYKGMEHPYDFTVQVQPGEIVLVAGRSGSGKSTLLDLIAGFRTPTSGSVRLDEKDLLPLPPEERPVSILFQNDNLFDHLSVARNLALGLPRGTSPADETAAITEALDQVGLPHYGDRIVTQLSGGQKQRVALARTLLREKPVVLLDEPFANLDAETAEEMRQLVKQLTNKQNWHTVIVSHLSEDAEVLADRAYWLENYSLAEA